MGALRDWTTDGMWLDGASGIGVVEHRIERDGVVKFRGSVTKLVAYASPINLVFPVDAKPKYDDLTPGPTYFDWTGQVNVNLNTYISGNQFAGAIYNNPGYVLDFSNFVWQGTPLPDPFEDHTIENVLAGLKLALAEIDGLRVYDFPADRVEPPAVVMALPPVSHVTFGDGAFDFRVPMWLLIAKANDRASTKELIPYLDPRNERSIRAAIAADRTLGGACDSVAVVEAEPQMATLAGTEYLAVEFTLEVIG